MEKQYRKKPIIISAIQWNGTNVKEVYEFIKGSLKPHVGIEQDKWADYTSLMKNKQWDFKTMESDNETQKADVGDFIIKGIKGECYPCKPDVFEMTYEEPLPAQSEEVEAKIMIELQAQASADMRTYNSETHVAVFRLLEKDFEETANAIASLIVPQQREAISDKRIKEMVDEWIFNGAFGNKSVIYETGIKAAINELNK